MHEYLKFFGTNNQQETVRFLIYERGLIKFPLFLFIPLHGIYSIESFVINELIKQGTNAFARKKFIYISVIHGRMPETYMA